MWRPEVNLRCILCYLIFWDRVFFFYKELASVIRLTGQYAPEAYLSLPHPPKLELHAHVPTPTWFFTQILGSNSGIVGTTPPEQPAQLLNISQWTFLSVFSESYLKSLPWFLYQSSIFWSHLSPATQKGEHWVLRENGLDSRPTNGYNDALVGYPSDHSFPHCQSEASTDEQSMLSSKKVRGWHPYPQKPRSRRFPRQPLCKGSSGKNPSEPTHPGWSSQSNPQRSPSPETWQTCLQEEERHI